MYHTPQKAAQQDEERAGPSSITFDEGASEPSRPPTKPIAFTLNFGPANSVSAFKREKATNMGKLPPPATLESTPNLVLKKVAEIETRTRSPSPNLEGPAGDLSLPAEESDPSRCASGPECLDKTYNKTHKDRLSEAKDLLNVGRSAMMNLPNMKKETRATVTECMIRMYEITQELDQQLKNSQAAPPTPSVTSNRSKSDKTPGRKKKATEKNKDSNGASLLRKMEELISRSSGEDFSRMLSSLAEHTRLIEESNRKMNELGKTLEKATYASVVTGRANTEAPYEASGHRERPSSLPEAMHSVVVSSSDDQDTEDQVLTKIREAIDAKEGWVNVEKVRKAKDRKVIVGCRTVEEREKVKERLKNAGTLLQVEEVQNKNPLVALRDVLSYNNDEDVIKALRNQNKDLFAGTDGDEHLTVKFRKKSTEPSAVSHYFAGVPGRMETTDRRWHGKHRPSASSRGGPLAPHSVFHVPGLWSQ